MGFLNEARREFIAAPDEAKSQIVYKWPDQNIRKFARAIVEPDAVAVFMSQGQLMGVLGPGQHRLEASELPFLGMFVDWGSNSNAFKAELYFVGAREFPRCRFGGRLDEVQDPQTGLIVTLRAFGEYALRVIDPTKLIINLVGTVDVTDNEAITGWVAQQLLKVTRTAITTNLMSGHWPILGLSVHSPEIEAATQPAANAQLADYGLAIARFGNLDVNLDDGDNARLKKLAGDTAYSRLAGGFLQAAQAEALQGAGEGMAQGGAAVGPTFLGAGFGIANQMMQPPPAAAPPPPPPPAPGFAGGGQGYAPPAPPAAPAAPAPAATTACGNCQSAVTVGAKFCPECGTPMQKHCTNCNASLSATAKFCAECGTPTSPPAPPPA
ncbi:MAG TPA: SPFH domain-containing protein [Streptosporangiaceae bacterium]|jgi:membrane protease subunit (stomatin/prohibitin family)|nr:SPFH domain-containing protein [Streptosporangiaceae bacterium]